MSSESPDAIPKLNAGNYHVWYAELCYLLQEKAIWSVVTGNIRIPESKAFEASKDKEKAFGIIMRSIEPALRAPVKDLTDPKKILDTLKDLYGTPSAGTRFNAIKNFLSLSQLPDERIPAFIARVRDAQRTLINSRPSEYTVNDFDSELLTSVLIGGTPAYSSLTETLLIKSDLKSSDVEAALVTAEETRLQHTDITALRTHTSPPAPNLIPTSKAILYCDFCDLEGSHETKRCFRMKIAKKQRSNQRSKANLAKVDTQEEFAGAASALSTPSFAAPDNWITDTGATAHMTPNHHWFKDYKPCHIPVRLADNNVIYAAGMGSVVFAPVIQGKSLRQIELSNVLHVPLLGNNLLSVLTLTRKHNFDVHIRNSTICFNLNNHSLFEATVREDNSAILNGATLTQSALSTSILSPDLWHRRFCHIGQNRLKQLLSGSYVTNLEIKSPQPLSPLPDLCQHCIAGKHHRFPFPHTASNRRTKPLELIHSDLHGPVSVQTPQKHQYWISFIDDCTRYRTIYLLHKKSDAFAAFKEFKAFAEKQTGYSIKALRDDKGGEYMSKEMDTWMKSHGILREHATPATPQQNGVAERTNRIFDEGITSMLNEAKLPGSFWGDALGTFVHVLNRSPSSSLKDITPYEAWFGRKPSVEHFRVFGCQAYVHVQKKQHTSFEPKSRQCIFLGYPPDYKGWKVYDPLTRKITISRDIIFDEQTMPGTKTSASDTFYIPLPSNPVPESGGEQSHSHRFFPLRSNDNDTLTSELDSESLPPSNPILPPSHSIPSPSPEPQNSPSPPPLPRAPSTSSSTQPTRSSTRITAGKRRPDWFKVTHPVGSGPSKWLEDYREPTPPVESDSESDSSGSEYAASQ